MLIRKINAYQIYDSRGIPTIEVEIFTESYSVRASVPSGKSTGAKEAVELRDGNQAEYSGKGINKAIRNINEIIAPEIIESELLCVEQQKIDQLMIKLDGTENKSNLGANAILAVSLAVAKLGADVVSQPLFTYLGGCNSNKLPVPMLNVINGGVHADNNIDFQEFMIVPFGFKSFSAAMRAGSEVYSKLKQILQSQGKKILVGDEGGFAPQINSISNILKLLVEAIEAANYIATTENKDRGIAIALDCAANELFVSSGKHKGKYFFKKYARNLSVDEQEKFYLSAEMLVSRYRQWASDFPIISIEDPFHEDDFEAFSLLTSKIGDRVQIVGDDIFVTNVKYLKRGIQEKAANSVLVKLNQIGTLTETINLIRYAQTHNFTTVISHRSGETTDNFIADLAVAFNTGLIKSGAPCRSERLSKYNRLLYIEQMLGSSADFKGLESFYNINTSNVNC